MIRNIVPQFYTTDLEKTFTWYNEYLGFSTDFTYGEPTFYGGIIRDGFSLYFRHVDEIETIQKDKDIHQYLDAMIAVDDVDALYKEYQEKNVPFQQDLEQMEWGARTFVVKDCDDRLLCFAAL